MLLACLPFGPWVTSKLTFWPSFRVLNPGMLIAEKCANRSSPPPSGVMKPNPLASLNHLTVPVAISAIPQEKESLSGRCPGPCFDLKEKRQRLQRGRVSVPSCLETKTRAGGYMETWASASPGGKAAGGH